MSFASKGDSRTNSPAGFSPREHPGQDYPNEDDCRKSPIFGHHKSSPHDRGRLSQDRHPIACTNFVLAFESPRPVERSLRHSTRLDIDKGIPTPSNSDAKNSLSSLFSIRRIISKSIEIAVAEYSPKSPLGTSHWYQSLPSYETIASAAGLDWMLESNGRATLRRYVREFAGVKDDAPLPGTRLLISGCIPKSNWLIIS